MRKFGEHMTEIGELRKELSSLEKSKEELTRKLRAMFKDIGYIREHMEDYKKYREEEERLRSEILDVTIKLKIMENNAKIALFHEMMPVAIDIMKKWKGKPYGDKTKEKIRKEMLDRTECALYLYWSQASIVHTKYNISIDIATKGDKDFLQHNKIQEVNIEDMFVAYINNTYFEDLDSAVQNLKKLHTEAVQKKKEFEDVCSRYNKLCVDGLRTIDSHVCIYGIV